MGIIYIATSRTSHKSYVGQTRTSFEKRMIAHRHKSKTSTYVFHCALAKYGEKDFDYVTIDNVSDDLLNEWEKYFIKILNTLAPHGYNLTDGGKAGILSEETKQKIRDKRKFQIITKESILKQSESMKGHYVSDETKRKISLSHIGMKASTETRIRLSEARRKRAPASEETRRKLSEANKGEKSYWYGKKGPMSGRHPSEETRRKISESNMGRKMSAEARMHMSESAKGKIITKETREKISKALMGHSFFGKRKINVP